MVITKEKKEETSIQNIRDNAIRQESSISLSLFNYCFLTYLYLTRELKKSVLFAKGILLDVGCGSCPYESYFTKHIEKYLKHDHPLTTKENIHYDYISELPKINAPSNSVDTIISISVLEHVSEPIETLKECGRILKANGILIVYVPQYWHLHEEPFDFYRFTKHLLREKLITMGFEIIQIKEIGKSFAVVGQAFCNAIVLMFDLGHVKNIFNFLSGKKTANIMNSIIYTIYKSPLIVLAVFLIPVINLTFFLLDTIIGSPRDTIGNLVIARKTP